jgi:GNAT superfamily N-acetyltransferase
MISSGVIRDLTPEMITAQQDAILKVASDIPEEYWQVEHFLRPLNLKWELSFGVFFDGVPQAYLIASERDGDTHIHHFMVSSEYRGKGVGVKMLSEIDKRARRQGSNRLTLKVQETNLSARNFYLRQAFRIVEKGIGQGGRYLLLEKPLVTNRTLAVHQPNYMPWLGYFHKIAQADVFIFLDDAEFSKNSFTNRNRIKTSQGILWLTIPVHVTLGQKISEVRFADDTWPTKHLKTLRSAYGKAKFFGSVFPWVESLLNRGNSGSLSEFNIRAIKDICLELGIDSDFRKSSEFAIQSKGDDRLIDLARKVGATSYLSGRGGANYQDPEKFVKAGLDFAYTSFSQPIYEQLWGAYVPNLSILDMLFNLGIRGTADLLKGSQGNSKTL